MELATSSFATSPDRPSLFELLAQDQLRGLLQPAVRYVVNVLAHSYPRYLIPIVNRHEEFYSLLMLVVERYHLKHHQASFSEYFYGLRRRRIPPLKTPRRDAFEGGSSAPSRTGLKKKDIRLSLIQLVLIPYLRLKLHELFLSLGGGVDPSILAPDSSSSSSSSANSSSRRHRVLSRLKQTFLLLYPWVNTGWEVASLFWNVAYLFDRTEVWSLESWALMSGRMRVGRITREDMESASPPSPASPTTSSNSLLSYLPSPPGILPLLLLSLKFLEFYHSPTSPFQLLSLSSPLSSSSSSKAHHPPLPPPPRVAPTTSGQALLDSNVKEWGDCPLCGEKWKGATVGGSGGWVYCWKCIEGEVERGEEDGLKVGGGRCPVSGMRVRRDELRRVLI